MIRFAVLAGLLALAGCPGGAQKSGPGGGGRPLDTQAPGGGSDGSKGGEGGGDAPVDPQTRCSADPLAGECPSRSRGPVVQEGELETVGAIDKTVVRRVVRDHFAALRYCYESTLLANPNIGGTVVVGFTIQIDGTVHDVTANGVHPDLESCLIGKVRSFQFPKPDGTKVEVSYPLTFKPS